MTRQSRLIVILGVMAGVGVGSLAFVANQYRKALAARPPDASLDGRRLVEGFLAAREAVRGVGARYADVRGNVDAIQALRNERYAAFRAHGMSMKDYVAVRSAWRVVRSGSPASDPYLAEAFRATPAALSDATLPPDLDDLDEELK